MAPRGTATIISSSRAPEGGSSSAVGGADVEIERRGFEAALGEATGDSARVEMRAGRSTRRIVIPGGYNLLEDSKQAAADMTLLCAAAEHDTLKGVGNRDLSRRFAGAALQVAFSFSFMSHKGDFGTY